MWSPLMQRHAGVFPDDMDRYTAVQLRDLQRYVAELEKREQARAVMDDGP